MFSPERDFGLRFSVIFTHAERKKCLARFVQLIILPDDLTVEAFSIKHIYLVLVSVFEKLFPSTILIGTARFVADGREQTGFFSRIIYNCYAETFISVLAW